jgi:hypothetical protein
MQKKNVVLQNRAGMFRIHLKHCHNISDRGVQVAADRRMHAFKLDRSFLIGWQHSFIGRSIVIKPCRPDLDWNGGVAVM